MSLIIQRWSDGELTVTNTESHSSYYFDIYDGDMSTNNGWHAVNGSWQSSNSVTLNPRSRTSIQTIQFRCRTDGVSNNWVYSDSVPNNVPNPYACSWTMSDTVVWATGSCPPGFYLYYDVQVTDQYGNVVHPWSEGNYWDATNLPNGSQVQFRNRCMADGWYSPQHGDSWGWDYSEICTIYSCPTPTNVYITYSVLNYQYTFSFDNPPSTYNAEIQYWTSANPSVQSTTNRWQSRDIIAPGQTLYYQVRYVAAGYVPSAWVTASYTRESRPSNWSGFGIVAGQQMQWYDSAHTKVKVMPSDMWYQFQTKINQFRAYVGTVYNYPFTSISEGMRFNYQILNEAVEAINGMLPSGQQITLYQASTQVGQSVFDTLTNKLNSIT